MLTCHVCQAWSSQAEGSGPNDTVLTAAQSRSEEQGWSCPCRLQLGACHGGKEVLSDLICPHPLSRTAGEPQPCYTGPHTTANSALCKPGTQETCTPEKGPERPMDRVVLTSG
jgi:ferredoxin-thioredoxin reductase catalytic subunit